KLADEPKLPPAERAVPGKGGLRLDKSAPEPDAGDTYKGVAPGAPALPPHPPRLPLKRGPQRLTWPGFQVKDGVPTVFLEVTGAPDYSVEEAPGAVVVTLR